MTAPIVLPGPTLAEGLPQMLAEAAVGIDSARRVGFVQLCPSLLVDPSEITLISSAGPETTRVYIKGNEGLSWLEVERPIHEVLGLVFETIPVADTADACAEEASA